MSDKDKELFLLQVNNLSQLFGVLCFKLLHIMQTFCQLLTMCRVPQLLFSFFCQPFSQQFRIQLICILQTNVILTRWIVPMLWYLIQTTAIMTTFWWSLKTGQKSKKKKSQQITSINMTRTHLWERNNITQYLHLNDKIIIIKQHFIETISCKQC